MVAMHALNRIIRLRCLYMALPLVALLSIPAYSQTFCQTSRNGQTTTCLGDNNEMTVIQRNGQNRSNDRNQSYYGNSVILGENQSYRDEQRRSEERRREMIYRDDRRERERSRSRYDDER